ncbi:MAG: hypothetical protein ABI614_26995 [Planctomycetota bacterium]
MNSTAGTLCDSKYGSRATLGRLPIACDHHPTGEKHLDKSQDAAVSYSPTDRRENQAMIQQVKEFRQIRVHGKSITLLLHLANITHGVPTGTDQHGC